MKSWQQVNCFSLLALLIAFRLAEAQPTKLPTIAVLMPDTVTAHSPHIAGFRQGMRELNYVEGQNIRVEYRYADGKRDRIPGMAAELIAFKPDIIVVTGGTLDAARNATHSIPIVVTAAGDLVADGYVASLARPGGNITGTTNIDADVSAKRLELLKDTIPGLSRVAVLSWQGYRQEQEELRETRAAAETLGLRIQSLEVKTTDQFTNAFASMTEERTQAVIITNNSFTFANRNQLFDLATTKRIPSMCGRDTFAEHGCVMSYGASRLHGFRRAAYLVDKILKGAKPADLPVEQPTKFELVVNLKTAKQISLTIPPHVLGRADRVIR